MTYQQRPPTPPDSTTTFANAGNSIYSHIPQPEQPANQETQPSQPQQAAAAATSSSSSSSQQDKHIPPPRRTSNGGRKRRSADMREEEDEQRKKLLERNRVAGKHFYIHHAR